MSFWLPTSAPWSLDPGFRLENESGVSPALSLWAAFLRTQPTDRGSALGNDRALAGVGHKPHFGEQGVGRGMAGQGGGCPLSCWRGPGGITIGLQLGFDELIACSVGGFRGSLIMNL